MNWSETLADRRGMTSMEIIDDNKKFGSAMTMEAAMMGMAVSISQCNSALAMHYNAPKLYGELKNRNPRKYAVLAGIACIFTTVIMFGIGLGGFLRFGSFKKEISKDVYDCPECRTKGDLLEAYGKTEISALMRGARWPRMRRQRSRCVSS